MKTSANGRRLIEAWEGLYLKTYRDSGGVWTIGYGHTSSAGLPRVKPGMIITEAQADQILASDLASVEADIDHHLNVPVNQNQYDALSSFNFNTGGLARSTILRTLNAGRPVTEEMFLRWSNVKGKRLAGLARRRHAEWIMYTTGKVVGP